MPEIKISKEEILTMLIDAYNDGYFDCDSGMEFGFNRNVKFWESELESKIVKETVSKEGKPMWRTVSEKPEIDAEYFVITHYLPCVARYSKNVGWYDTRGAVVITHWMPIPAVSK